LLTHLKALLKKTQTRISGKSDLAGAIRYALSRWEALTLVLRNGRACIDNNAAGVLRHFAKTVFGCHASFSPAPKRNRSYGHGRPTA
jgi:hypothetical protein